MSSVRLIKKTASYPAAEIRLDERTRWTRRE